MADGIKAWRESGLPMTVLKELPPPLAGGANVSSEARSILGGGEVGTTPTQFLRASREGIALSRQGGGNKNGLR